ncbi:uncharacterized protein LOC117651354 isoform X2 [Thrips palmi]|uniref:Uncharacterized protein LOC117651354 isoform X2 n=1 Tax=Thrips palmi TaxID=161013 RepID=A0A6P9A1B7_THRPL|nr:uncharacterized protein LOC117651354 isoform X2 [Thrips palmi]
MGEEERMLLQRQFDLLVQSNHDKERARVSVVEARYKRFLDEDKRRRDRNSSLLQALDRIDSHTASLAAKTERMRSLRKHYEAFIAHSYPGWQLELERPYCPLAAIAPAPNVMARVTDVTEYDSNNPRCFPDTSEFSDTQYHALPAISPKPYSPLASPLCRSELAISTRDDFPSVGRSLYRTGSAAIRSASLSPSRVRDLSSQYDAKKMTSPSIRNYDSYSPSKISEVGLSPRLRNESNFTKINNGLSSPREPSYQSNLQTYGQDRPISYRPLSTTNHCFLDYDHGTSEADLNTSGDLLNLSNLSLSDDGVLNDPEILDSSSRFSPISHPTYTSPRDYGSSKQIPSISLSIPPASVRHHVSPREVYIPKRSASLSPSLFTSPSPKSILSPRSRKSDVTSDSVHRILYPSDADFQRTEPLLSPRRQKSTWQTLRPSYLPPPSRSTIRRSVTFSEPEYETPYSLRDEAGSPYSGSYGSLRRHSPSSPISNWESSDHERYLREKQSREKDAFREKIERLKELIKENKDHEMGFACTDTRSRSPSFQPKVRDHEKEKCDSLESSIDRDWKASQSRRSSLATELVSDDDDEENISSPYKNANKTDELESKNGVHTSKMDFAEDVSEPITDKEHWSGKFNEKDEDAKENLKAPEIKDKGTKDQSESEKLNLDDGYAYTPYESTEFKEGKEFKDTENPSTQSKQESQGEHAQPNDGNKMDQERVNDTEEKQLQDAGKESSDFIYMESIREGDTGEPLSEKAIDFEHSDNLQKVDQTEASFQNNLPTKEGQENLNEYQNNYNYEADPKQQEWATNEDGGTQGPQNMQYDDSTPTGYENQSQNNAALGQESGFEGYQTEGGQEQQRYENYQSNTAPDQQPQENYGENAGYEQYQEPKQATETGYQEYSEDPGQYQQNYQAYSEDQQYNEQQDPTYNAQDPGFNSQDPNSYQYSQDPNKNQYQEYNYEQNQEAYDYSQDPNYQQDQAYQQEQQYQSDQAYLQDPNYSQDQQYQQSSEYQQGQQYQEAGYDGSGQYQGYQPGTDDLSEETTPSADSNYQGQTLGGEAKDQSQTLEQYRALLGADPSSEPGFSDSSEIENQMAAVVGLGGNSSVVEQAPATSPPVAPAAAKGKAKKKPQLTRKQSSITADSVEGNEQKTPSLPKTPEVKSDPAAPQQSDSDFDISSQ